MKSSLFIQPNNTRGIILGIAYNSSSESLDGRDAAFTLVIESDGLDESKFASTGHIMEDGKLMMLTKLEFDKHTLSIRHILDYVDEILVESFYLGNSNFDLLDGRVFKVVFDSNSGKHEISQLSSNSFSWFDKGKVNSRLKTEKEIIKNVNIWLKEHDKYLGKLAGKFTE